MKRTFKSDNGVKFLFERINGNWVHTLTSKKFYIVTDLQGGMRDILFSQVKGKGKYMDGTKYNDTKRIGRVFTMTDACNGLETYRIRGAWWE